MLVDELGLDPGRELVELEQLLLRQDPSLDPAVVREVSSGCPYRGLLPYDAEDADSFFGRENDVAACLRRLRETGVLAVVGPSGVGKSSLVRAGVVAALARTETAVLVTTPGAHPLDSLARLKGGGRQTLVVDQAEDAVTACTDPGERERYFAALAGHVAAGGALALAMRADHLGDLAPYPEIARIVEDGLYLLGPMSEPDLRSAVEGPARQAGLRLEPGLVDLLVRDVEGEPAALPLLSHVLRETWERREGPTLTVAGYRSTGGIRSAVSQSAERLYDAMDAAQRGRLRSLLLRLVVPTGGGDPVRARVPRAKVSADGEHRRLVEQLVDARLVSVDGDSLQIAHESLVRVWPRLRGWLDDDLDGQRLFRHLADAADAWDQMGRPDSELYRGAQGVLHEDVAAGLLLAVEGVQADQSSQAWENLGATLTRAGALSVVRDVGDMVGAPGTAEMPSVSTSSAGGLVAGNVLGDVARLFDEATLAPLPFRQAPRDTISVAMSPDGSRLAVTTAGNDDRPVKLYDLPNGTPAQRQPGGVPADLAVGYEPNDPEPMFSRDGSRMVTALRRPSPLGEWSSWGRTMVWDVADPSEPVFTIRLPASAQSALSPDGDRLYVATPGDRPLRVYDVPSGRLFALARDPAIADGNAQAVDVSPDGSTLAVAVGNRVHRYDTVTLRPEGPALQGHTGPLQDVGYSHEPHRDLLDHLPAGQQRTCHRLHRRQDLDRRHPPGQAGRPGLRDGRTQPHPRGVGAVLPAPVVRTHLHPVAGWDLTGASRESCPATDRLAVSPGGWSAGQDVAGWSLSDPAVVAAAGWGPELGVSVGGVDPDLPGGGVQQGVMPAAQHHQVVQVRRTTIDPVDDVVGVAGDRQPPAPWECAPAVPQHQGVPLAGGDQPLRPAHVQHLTLAAQHGGDDLGVAGQPAHRGRRQRQPVHDAADSDPRGAAAGAGRTVGGGGLVGGVVGPPQRHPVLLLGEPGPDRVQPGGDQHPRRRAVVGGQPVRVGAVAGLGLPAHGDQGVQQPGPALPPVPPVMGTHRLPARPSPLRGRGLRVLVGRGAPAGARLGRLRARQRHQGGLDQLGVLHRGVPGPRHPAVPVRGERQPPLRVGGPLPPLQREVVTELGPVGVDQLDQLRPGPGQVRRVPGARGVQQHPLRRIAEPWVVREGEHPVRDHRRLGPRQPPVGHRRSGGRQVGQPLGQPDQPRTGPLPPAGHRGHQVPGGRPPLGLPGPGRMDPAHQVHAYRVQHRPDPLHPHQRRHQVVPVHHRPVLTEQLPDRRLHRAHQTHRTPRGRVRRRRVRASSLDRLGRPQPVGAGLVERGDRHDPIPPAATDRPEIRSRPGSRTCLWPQLISTSTSRLCRGPVVGVFIMFLMHARASVPISAQWRIASADSATISSPARTQRTIRRDRFRAHADPPG